jgi:hypothetical protein
MVVNGGQPPSSYHSDVKGASEILLVGKSLARTVTTYDGAIQRAATIGSG